METETVVTELYALENRDLLSITDVTLAVLALEAKDYQLAMEWLIKCLSSVVILDGAANGVTVTAVQTTIEVKVKGNGS